MKKLLALLLALIMVASVFTACGGDKDSAGEESKTESKAESKDEASTAPAESKDEASTPDESKTEESKTEESKTEDSKTEESKGDEPTITDDIVGQWTSPDGNSSYFFGSNGDMMMATEDGSYQIEGTFTVSDGALTLTVGSKTTNYSYDIYGDILVIASESGDAYDFAFRKGTGMDKAAVGTWYRLDLDSFNLKKFVVPENGIARDGKLLVSGGYLVFYGEELEVYEYEVENNIMSLTVEGNTHTFFLNPEMNEENPIIGAWHIDSASNPRGIIFYEDGTGITYVKGNHTAMTWSVSEDGSSVTIKADGVTITHPIRFNEYKDILSYNDVWFNRVYTSTRY